MVGEPRAPSPPAVKSFEREPRKRPPPSRPMVCSSSIQKPSEKQRPEKGSSSRLEPPNRTVVPGPMAPPDAAGPAVTSGGTWLPLVHHSR